MVLEQRSVADQHVLRDAQLDAGDVLRVLQLAHQLLHLACPKSAASLHGFSSRKGRTRRKRKREDASSTDKSAAASKSLLLGRPRESGLFARHVMQSYPSAVSLHGRENFCCSCSCLRRERNGAALRQRRRGVQHNGVPGGRGLHLLPHDQQTRTSARLSLSLFCLPLLSAHKRRCSCTSTAATTASGDSCAALPLEWRRRSARTRRCFPRSKRRSWRGNRALPAIQVRDRRCAAQKR